MSYLSRNRVDSLYDLFLIDIEQITSLKIQNTMIPRCQARHLPWEMAGQSAHDGGQIVSW